MPAKLAVLRYVYNRSSTTQKSAYALVVIDARLAALMRERFRQVKQLQLRDEYLWEMWWQDSSIAVVKELPPSVLIKAGEFEEKSTALLDIPEGWSGEFPRIPLKWSAMTVDSDELSWNAVDAESNTDGSTAVLRFDEIREL